MVLKFSKKFAFLILNLFFILLLPGLALGQINFPLIPTGQVLNIPLILLTVLNIVWVVAVTAVIIMFVLAGFKFLTAQGDPSKLEEARRAVIWGILGGIVIILSFSIVMIIKITFNL